MAGRGDRFIALGLLLVTSLSFFAVFCFLKFFCSSVCDFSLTSFIHLFSKQYTHTILVWWNFVEYKLANAATYWEISVIEVGKCLISLHVSKCV